MQFYASRENIASHTMTASILNLERAFANNRVIEFVNLKSKCELVKASKLTVRNARISSALMAFKDLPSTGIHCTSSRSAPIPDVSEPNHDFLTKSPVSRMLLSSVSDSPVPLPELSLRRWNLGVPRNEFLIELILVRHGIEVMLVLLPPPDAMLFEEEAAEPIFE